jgi:SAM-dependent methyltransferase
MVDHQQFAVTDDFIDVHDLIRTLTVEQLAAEADDYCKKHLDDPEYYFAKPFTNVDETPDHLVYFAHLIRGLRLMAGMRVLDFGAGTGWSTRYLAQLGMDAIACDVSETALDVARQLLVRFPVAATRPEPTFLSFDGHRIDLADESVDRVFSFDSFHHVPNQAEVLGEFGRVLKQGGIAGFSEPGPNHSKTAESQFEMRNYNVVENDMIMTEVWAWAKTAGFTSLEISIFDSQSFRLSLPDFDDFLRGGRSQQRYVDHVRDFVSNRRIFFLSKGDLIVADSRNRDGLAAELEVQVDRVPAEPDGLITGQCRARNVGRNLWLPSDAPYGPVQLGVHLYRRDGGLIDRDYVRVPMGRPEGVRPGQEVEIPFALPAPAVGEYRLEFDMVSEKVCWFETNGCHPASVDVSIA